METFRITLGRWGKSDQDKRVKIVRLFTEAVDLTQATDIALKLLGGMYNDFEVISTRTLEDLGGESNCHLK